MQRYRLRAEEKEWEEKGMEHFPGMQRPQVQSPAQFDPPIIPVVTGAFQFLLDLTLNAPLKFPKQYLEVLTQNKI